MNPFIRRGIRSQDFLRMAAAAAAVCFCGLPQSARALSPMYGLQGLVAGGDAGDTDGPFDQARFGDPQGMAFDPKTERLYVADAKNASLRVVELGQQNRVWTLGRQQPFDFGGIALKHPLALAWLNGDQRTLALLDPGLPGLVLLDLDQRRVSGVFRPQSGTAGDAARSLLEGATDLEAGPNGLMVSAQGQAQLGLFDAPGGVPRLRKIWTVAGVPTNADGLKSIRWVGGYLLGIVGAGAAAKVARIAAPGGEIVDFPASPGPLPVSLSAAVPVTQPALAEAFVKAGDPFNLVCGAPLQVASVGARDGGFGLDAMGIYDQDDHVLYTQDPKVYMRPGESAPADNGIQHFAWLTSPGRATADLATKTWYISDPNNHRVLYVRPIYSAARYYDVANDEGVPEYNFPHARRSFLRRVLLAGLSIMFYPADTERRGNSMGHRLEHYLNLEASLRDQPKGYESLFVGAVYGFIPGSTGTFGTLRQRWDKLSKAYDPDMVVVPVLANDLFFPALEFNSRTVDDQGLPSLDFDSEYALNGPSAARQPKSMKALKAAIIAHRHPDWAVSPKGEIVVHFDRASLVAAEAQNDPDMMAPLSEMTQAYVKDLKDRIDATAKTLGHPVKLVLVFIPISESVSVEEAYRGPDEMLDPNPYRDLLSGTAQALGIPFVDLTSSIRVWSANAPFLYYFTNRHMTARGEDAAAYVLARRLFDLAGPGAQP